MITNTCNKQEGGPQKRNPTECATSLRDGSVNFRKPSVSPLVDQGSNASVPSNAQQMSLSLDFSSQLLDYISFISFIPALFRNITSLKCIQGLRNLFYFCSVVTFDNLYSISISVVRRRVSVGVCSLMVVCCFVQKCLQLFIIFILL